MSSGEIVSLVGGRIGEWEVDDLVAFGDPQRFLCRKGEGDDERSGLLAVASIGSDTEKRLQREHDALRVLDHPCLPKVLDFGRDESRRLVYLATDWFDGDALADWLITGPLDWKDACQVIRRVAEALAEVHNNSIVHRDVNPSKIQIGPNWSARLVGFDLALDSARSTTSADLPSGQIAYVAPEVIAGNDQGPRSDLYALGVVFYEAITGRSAFPAALRSDRDANQRALQWKTRAEPLDPGESAPPWLARLIQKATDPDPAKRLPDMDALIGWLDAAEAAWKAPREVAPPPVAAPPPVLQMAATIAPSIAPPPIRPIERAPAPRPQAEAPSLLSPSLAYGLAVVLGVFAAFGFSALIIVISEVSAAG